MSFTDKQSEALKCDKSMCVTAGAGTGKTHVLVNRYIKLIKEKGCMPSEILALTFTDKAAAEMKERVEAGIREESGGNWESVKEEMIRANICTFHSFCTMVLREYPIESEIESNFSVLTKKESEDIFYAAVVKLFSGERVGSIDSESQRELNKALTDCLTIYGAPSLKDQLQNLHNERRISRLFFEKLETDRESIIETYRAFLDEIKSKTISEFNAAPQLNEYLRLYAEIAETCGSDYGKTLESYFKELAPLLKPLRDGAFNSDQICSVIAKIGTIKGEGVRYMPSMGDKKFKELYPEFKEAFSTLKGFSKEQPCDILAIAADKNRENKVFERTLSILKLLSIVFFGLEKIISKEKQSSGAIDFTDMIDLTHKLFFSHPEILRNDYSKRFRYIMIDEFQDTDPIQVEIIKMILKSCYDSASDEEIKDRLFVVGDPKQSIYLFRNADVTQFKQTIHKITESYNGENIVLDMNFRSAPKIMNFVNLLFSCIMHDEKEEWDFRYDPLEPFRNGYCGDVEILLTKTEEKKKSGSKANKNKKGDDSKNSGGINDSDLDTNESESESASIQTYITKSNAAADRIRKIIEDKTLIEKKSDEEGQTSEIAKYSDIAILVENRTHIEYLENALDNRDIPYRMYKGKGFYRKQEISDCISVLNVLRNEDDISLYAALRSPWFELSDAELYMISKESGHNFLEKLKNYAMKDGVSEADTDNESVIRARNAYELIVSWMKVSRRILPSELFEKICRESGITVIYAGLIGGIQMNANIVKLSEIIRDAENRGFYTLDKVCEDLESLAKLSDDEGEATLEESDTNAVSIMTIHASKGLEFPIVILPNFKEREKGITDSVITDAKFGIGIRIPSLDDEEKMVPSPPLMFQRYLLNQKLYSESKRLFYVACTRARDRLIIISPNKSDIPSSEKDCNKHNDWIRYYLIREILRRKNSVNSADNTESSGESKKSDDVLIPSGEYHISQNGYECDLSILNASELVCHKYETESEISVDESSKYDISNLSDEIVTVPRYDAENCGRSESEVHIFSASEIEAYLHDPVEHYNRYIRHETTNPLLKFTKSKETEYLDDLTNEGTIIHAVLAGEDPKEVLRSQLSTLVINADDISDNSDETDKSDEFGKSDNSDILENAAEDAEKIRKYEKIRFDFLNSEFMRDVTDSYCELKFNLCIGKYMFTGAVDRLVKKRDGWYIIDYKTGYKKPAINGQSDDNSKYFVQMAIYKTAIERLLNTSVKTYIYYTRCNEFSLVDFDCDKICSEIEEVCDKIEEESAQ